MIRTAVAALPGMLAGCSLASQIGATAPAGITQQLLIRSLERVLGDIDVARIGTRPVALEVGVQAGNDDVSLAVEGPESDAPHPGVGKSKYFSPSDVDKRGN